MQFDKQPYTSYCTTDSVILHVPINMLFKNSQLIFNFFINTQGKKLVETVKKSNEVKRKLQIKSFHDSVERLDSNSSVIEHDLLPVSSKQHRFEVKKLI